MLNTSHSNHSPKQNVHLSQCLANMLQVHSKPGTSGTERARTLPVTTPTRAGTPVHTGRQSDGWVSLRITDVARMTPKDRRRRWIIEKFWDQGVLQWANVHENNNEHDHKIPRAVRDPRDVRLYRGMLEDHGHDFYSGEHNKTHRGAFTIHILFQPKSRSSRGSDLQSAVIETQRLPYKIFNFCREACQEAPPSNWSCQSKEIETAFDTLFDPYKDTIKEVKSQRNFAVHIEFLGSRSQSIISDVEQAVAEMDHGTLAERLRSQPRSNQANSSTDSDSYVSKPDDSSDSETDHEPIFGHKARATTNALKAKPRTARATTDALNAKPRTAKPSTNAPNAKPLTARQKAAKIARTGMNRELQRRRRILNPIVARGRPISLKFAQKLMARFKEDDCAGTLVDEQSIVNLVKNRSVILSFQMSPDLVISIYFVRHELTI